CFSRTNTVTITEPAALSLAASNKTDATCNGTSTGIVTAGTVTNAVGSVSYSWKNSSNIEVGTTATVNNLPAGTYTLTVSDNCFTRSNSVTINEPAALSLAASSKTDATCNGTSTGSVTTGAVTNAVGSVSYSWKNSSNVEVGTTATVDNLPAGTYTLTVSDNCFSRTNTVTINEPAVLALIVASQINVDCFGNNNGSVTLQATGGTPSYSYSIDGITYQSSSTFNNLSAGTYNITVKDRNSCSLSIPVTITQPSEVTLTGTATPILCNGEVSKVTLVATGGTSTFTYSKDGVNYQSNNVFDNLIAGSYTFYLKDNNGCSKTYAITISEPSALVFSESHTDVKCYGDASGSINISVSGGTSSYTYNWSNGKNTEDIIDLVAGNYTVKITDANGCYLYKTITITQPIAPLAVAETHENVKCYGDANGSINISVSGGTAPYTYSWSNGENTEDLNNLVLGTYTVHITDANGCATSKTITITQPTAPLSVAESHTDVKCFGDASGSIDISVNGGTTPYTYNWSNGKSTEDITDLAAGNYTIIITDTNGCKVSKSITINQPIAPLAITETHENVKCYGDASGSIDISVSGGTSPYTYNWSNGVNSEDIYNLTSGTYTINIKDANGCTISKTVTITQPTAPLAIIETHENVKCYSDANGSIDISVSGGTAPYTYAWSNGFISEDLSNLSSGIYSVSIKDANGCIASKSITITQPTAPLSITEIHQNVKCYGDANGSIDISVSGGTAPYTYNWSNGKNTEDVINLTLGTYTVNVIDAKGCSTSTTITITQPTAPLIVSESHNNVKCYGDTSGNIDISVSGGTAPYTYSWSNGSNNEDITGLASGTYTVTIKDFNGCSIVKTVTITQPTAPLSVVENHANVKCFGDLTGIINISVSGGTAPYTYTWSNGEKTEDLSGVKAGSYTVNIIDANGCTISKMINITQPIAPIVITETHTDVSCFGFASGSIQTNVTGGTAPYTYSWSNGAKTKDISALPVGDYTLTVKDANNCSSAITVTIRQPLAPLTLLENHQDIFCYGDAAGTINLTVNGGTEPYTYLWSNNETTKDLTGLKAGTYSVVVTDAKGCTIGKLIKINQPAAPLTIQETHQNINCYGEQTGSISINVLGGTSPYTYAWANGSTLQNVTNLSAGTYDVKVTDKNGCVAIKQIQIKQPAAPLTLTEAHVNNVCYGEKVGKIDVTVVGGTAPYTYKWNTGQTTQDISNLSPGNYELLVTDKNSCTQSISVIITPLKPFVVTETVQNVKCFNDNSGSIVLKMSGGKEPYTVTWNNGVIGESISSLISGNYTYKAVDAYGCTIQKTIAITQPLQLTATLKVSNTTCKYSEDGGIEAAISGGTPPYRILWDDVDRGQKTFVSNLKAGKHSVKIFDANNCYLPLFGIVLPGNCAPAADNDKYVTSEDIPITIQTPGIIINDNDPDDDAIKVSLNTVRDPDAPQGNLSGNAIAFETKNGAVRLNSEGSFTYTPKKNFNGVERFMYKVSDGSLMSNTATVSIQVLAVNDPPVAVDDNFTTLEDTPVNGTVATNDSDIDLDPLIYNVTTQPAVGVLAFNADGSFRYVPPANYNGTVTFNYQVCDPSGACATAKVTIVITPVNDPPIAEDDLFKTQINKPITGKVTLNDSDPDSDPLQFTKLTSTAHGSITFNSDGTFIYMPNSGYKGKDTFTYNACDPSGLCDNATVTILVQPLSVVNLTPSIGVVKEGDKISVTAKLTESMLEDITVTLAFSGSATKDADYTLTGDFVKITIPEGQTTTTQEFTIHAINDALRDPGEQVKATMIDVSSIFVSLGDNSTITIDDVYPESSPTTPDENGDINPDPLVSPNGDGQGNETFLIYNISKYPDNEVAIFNRWGNELFRIKGYNNEDRSFKGVANVGILTNTNRDLIDGVYYYIIYTTQNGVKKVNKGYLILKR
ncbi:Ig-like domain-containing protein, partial [Pelobium sp.]